MVKINLLPIKGELKRKALIEHGVFLILVIILVVIGISLFHGSMNKQREALQQEIISTKADIVKITAIAGEIETFKKRKQELERKLDVIRSLRAKKGGPVEILDQISMLIPEKAWLISLSNSGDSLALNGVAVDNPTIALFMKKLQMSSYFKDVVLVFTQQEGPNHKFVINCKVKLPR
ncbi:MAG: PilN domain-containing protein [Deltaproteobacteria bacterium]|nr:PilN domain-containing protein [Deltaproteobacteria bacterium]